AEKKAQRGAGTFGELHARYLEEHAKRRNKSWPQADALIRRNIMPRWGKLDASTITRGDVKAMMARIEAPSVANQVLAACSAVFTWGIGEDIVSANPCRGVARTAAKSRERVLADSQIPLFGAAFEDAGLIVGSALKMILLTGQRPGEVAHMRREHIKDGWWERGTRCRRWGGRGPRTRRRIGCGSLPRCRPSWPRWVSPTWASCSEAYGAARCTASTSLCAGSVRSLASSARRRTIYAASAE